MKIVNLLLSAVMASTMVFSGAGLDAQAAQGVYAEVSEDGAVIGNGYLTRSFRIEDGRLRTDALHNLRIDRTLIPQEGSDDFVIETLAQPQGEEVIPTQELERGDWRGEVTGTGSDHVEDAANLFDGNDATETDYYVTGTDFPYTLTVDLGASQTFQSFSFQKRQGNANVLWGINGTVGKYRLQVSEDGIEWIDAGSGEFTREDYNLHEIDGIYNIGDLVYGSFDQAYTARYVRLISDSGALSEEKTFNGAEFRLYEDAYVEPTMPQTTISSSDLTLEDAQASDTETGGKQLAFDFEPYTLNGVDWDLSYHVVMEEDDHFMRSYVEIRADEEENAKIDHIDLDHFVLSDEVEGLWSRPEDFHVADGAYNFLESEMLLGQPIYADGMFFGSEFPAADTDVEDDAMQIRYYSGKSLAQLREEGSLDEQGAWQTWPNVIGAAQGTDTDVVQTDFFAYIDTIATKTEFRVQYNSWYDNRMGITDERIAATFYGTENGLSEQGVAPLDSYVMDDGWNNYNDPDYTGIDTERSGNSYNQTGFWEFNDKFPNELYTASSMAANFDASFGLWLGPQGGYELQGTFSQYIESSGTGYVHPTAALGNVICTGSKKYIDNLTSLFVDYQERFDVDYWKLDGFASRPCTQADHDHMTGGDNNMYFTSELWENWTDAFETMRAQRAAEGKGLYINATCYAIPSPWLLQWVNTVWQHNAGDLEKDGTNGGSDAQQMISGRDNIYFRNARDAELQFPLKNVYNHEPIYGSSAGVTMNTEEFRQYMMANVVRGTSFWELYFSPSMMDEEKWMVSADVLEFAQRNAHILEHAKLFGDAPRTGSVYGYSSWDGAEGIISFRNPSASTKTYTLKLDETVGVTDAVQAVKQVQILPYTAEASAQRVSYGDELTVTLGAYEEVIYQFTNESESAPQIVYAKVSGEDRVRVKFDRRIVDDNGYQINGQDVEMTLLDDYRTVELSASAPFAEDEEITLTIQDIAAINGASISKELTLLAYKDDMIAQVSEKSDLIDAQDVQETIFERNGVNVLTIDDKYALSDDHGLNAQTSDFTISMLLQSDDANAQVLSQGDELTIGIDENGFIYYKDTAVQLTSRHEVTTVTEKAHGTFGSDAYVPTSAETETAGQINDGNLHLIHIVRAHNGMAKIYIDGELASSAYADGDMAKFTQQPMTLGSEGIFANITEVKVRNDALSYNAIEAEYASYRLSAEDSAIAKTAWTASADSEELNGASNEGPASFAIDGNESTLWHTEYRASKPKCPHWFMIDLGEMTTFDKLEYVSRNGNGSIRDYTLEISADGEQWETISEGTMPKAGATMLEFDQNQNARYVRIHIETSYGVDSANENIFGSIAEISLYRSNPAASDYRALITVIHQAEALSEADHTPESWAQLKAALQNARTIAADVNAIQDTIDAAETQLRDAIDALETIGEDQASDAAVEALKTMVDKANALGSEDAALNEAIANAQAVLDKDAPTATEVVTALLNLSEAMQAVNAGESVDALREDVQATIDFINENILNDVEGLRPVKVQALIDAVAAAQDAVDDPEADADQLKAANEAMTKAAQELWEIVTKAELEALIEAANGYLDGDYTAESLEALQTAITAAQAVAANDDATTAEVTDAITNLANAIAALESITLDTSALAHEIELVTEMVANIGNYVPSTVEGLADKLADAQNVLENATTQAEIDAATETLREARLNARTKADVSALEELIAYVNSLELRAYTSASAQPVIQDLARAKAMLTNEEVTQEEVDNMVDALQASVDNLVEVNNSTNAEDTTNTAAAMQTGLFAGLLAASAGLALMVRRRRTTNV